MSNKTQEGSPQTPVEGGEHRWWMWLAAICTLLLVFETHRRLQLEWGGSTLAFCVLSAVAVIAVCSQWRGHTVSALIGIAGASTILTVLKHLLRD